MNKALSAQNPKMQAAAPKEYELLIHKYVVAEENITVDNTKRQVLYWISSQVSASQQALIEDIFGFFNDVRVLTEKDMRTMASNFSFRTQTNGRMNCFTRRIKYIKAFSHWVQDFYRVSGLPSIVGLYEVKSKPYLDKALTRAGIKKSMANQTKTSANAASPQALENEKQWKYWEETFVKYSRSHIGANFVPLAYMICENEEPDINGEHPEFINKKVDCAPLEEDYWTADRVSVFNIFVYFTTLQPSSDWIKTTMKHSDGRRLMEKFCRHFSGYGNATRNLTEAERLNK